MKGKRRPAIDVAEISTMLADRASMLAREIFPAGVKDGPEFRIGSLAGEKGRSMAIRVEGNRAGVWSDFQSGEAGDALDLVSMTLFAGDKGKAVQWAKAWLGIEDGKPIKVSRPAPPVKRPAAEADTNAQAFRLWLASRETLLGTPAEAYLAGRRIRIRDLSRQPSALRFHSALANTESGRQWPAIVAAIHGRKGRVVAVHRTWLEVHANGRVTKAPLKDPKMTLGRYRGGCIRIWRGASGKPLASAPGGETVVITEGIEDALTVALARPQHRVLAAVSLGNMTALELPAQLTDVMIAADDDGDNKQALKALTNAARNFQGQGRRVRIARPPQGFKDFNEVLQRGA